MGIPACAHTPANEAPSPAPRTPPRGVPSSSGTIHQLGVGQAGGSQSPSAGCPGGNGIHISVNSGTGTSRVSAQQMGSGDTLSLMKPSAGSDSASRANAMSSMNAILDDRHSIDTTLVFDVAQKTWTRTNLAAAITAGLADDARGGYAICAGVTALIPSANLTINGARGRVHFAATLQSLLNSIQSGPAGTTSQLRRM